jgi:GNAT superfamily N-acetyltransferase
MMLDIRPAQTVDVGEAVAALAEAFGPDPLMQYFFSTYADGVRAATMAFFSILLRARISLGMPAYVLLQDGAIMGAVMGYDTTHPVWPPELDAEWNALEDSVPGVAARFAAYEAISANYAPAEDHYYLGVIGAHPALQGKGAGKALIDAFCGLSRADPKSHGVYLETGNPSSLAFYLRNGFQLRGEGQLEGNSLWCVYRPNALAA